MELWKPVPQYEGLYEVSDMGRVRSLDKPTLLGLGRGRGASRKGRVLKPGQNVWGYSTITLSKEGTTSTRTVHGLVLTAFVGPRPEGMEARHIDSNKANNELRNLQWGTRSQNTFDQVVHGTHRNTRKTHCPLGHPLESPNLVKSEQKKGRRMCRSCHCAKTYIRSNPQHELRELSDQYFSRFQGAS